MKSGDITTEVLGTEFNVRTLRPRDSHVTLLKGSESEEHGFVLEVVIQPGKTLIYKETGLRRGKLTRQLLFMDGRIFLF